MGDGLYRACTWHSFSMIPRRLASLVFLACPRRLLRKCGTKLRSLICSPLLPNFNITSGHSHLCVLTPPMTPLSQDYGGGKDPKTIHKYMWPYIKSPAELEAFVDFCFNQLPLTCLCPPQKINFKDRKKGDILDDCMLFVDGTDFRLAMGYSKPFWSCKI